jgi:hypothetical protein
MVVAPLWKIAAPELGLAPMMSIEGNGIYITRDDVDCTVLAYSFQAGRHYTRELLEGLARHILDQSLVDDAFLIKNGFKREYGARVNMKKPVPSSLPTPPVRRVKRATPIRRAARAIALRLSRLSPRV